MATRTITQQNGSLAARQAQTTYSTAPTSQLNIARPYKDFLTPALHRRFTKATGLVLALCWLEGICMSQAGWFWSWFPLGLTGLRALALFIPCLAVFIIRVANVHIGERTTCSPVETLVQLAMSWRTLVTVGWYAFSGWFFGEVYIWTRSQAADLGWVDQGRAYERPRVNENPIFLRTLFVLLAVVQSALHLAWDNDRVSVSEAGKDSKTNAPQDQSTSKLPQSLQQLSARSGRTVKYVLNTTAACTVANFPVYFLLARRWLWPWTYWFASLYFRNLPPRANPAGLIHLPTLIWQALTSSVMLVLLWELSNAVFTIYASEPPLKKDQPLTNEILDATGTILSRSRDPNGSLIKGLRAKNEVPKSFAFAELQLICTNFPLRRKAIFTEVDRSADAGSTWCQISTLCLAELSAITNRIQTAQNPNTVAAESQAQALQRKQQEAAIAQQQQQIHGLPKIANQGVRNEQVTAPNLNSRTFTNTVGTLAKSLGQSPGSLDALSPRARRAAHWGVDHALSQQTQNRLSPQSLAQGANAYILRFLHSPLGQPFRQTFARRVRAVVFGVPSSNAANIAHAAQALAALAVVSLKEDDYGQVAKDIPAIVRTLTNVIAGIGGFVAGLQPHWTDVEFEDGDRRVAEVEGVVGVLKTALEEVVLAFGEYADAVGLTRAEVWAAREAVGKGGKEMRQIAR